MAAVSFRLRRSDDIGSTLRYAASTDLAIRSDYYLEPSSNLGTSYFSASVMDAYLENGHYKSQIDIELSLETALASTLTTTIQPIGVVVVASTYGEPLTIEDGESIFSWNSSQYSETFTHYSTRYTEQQRVYYSLFVQYGTTTVTWYERVGTLNVLLPILYNSISNLWDKIPEYYKQLDQLTGNSDLYRFLTLFGWEIDKTRTLIDEVMVFNDPLLAPPVILDKLAKQLGIEITTQDLGTSKLRAILYNVFTLRKSKGTIPGTINYVAALSGCKTTYNKTTSNFNIYTQRVNMLSDPKFKETSLNNAYGYPASINRLPFTLRGTSDGSSLRDPARTDLAIRGATTNSSGYAAYEYTTNRYTSTAASVGWGVYTYGSAMVSSGASYPVIDHIQYYGNDLQGASVPVVVSNANGIKITIPITATGNQEVVVYGRKPFKFVDEVDYYTSFNASLSGASFNNFRFVKQDDVVSYLEIATPDALGEPLFYDDWNTVKAETGNRFYQSVDTFYNSGTPNTSTFGRFAVKMPSTTEPTLNTDVVVPTLTFTAKPGDSIVISEWMVEPNGLGKYFDGDTTTGGFIRQTNQVSAVGISDYRWGTGGGASNQDFSYYTLDYGRVVPTVERILYNNLMPITMLGNYTVTWDVLPGD